MRCLALLSVVVASNRSRQAILKNTGISRRAVRNVESEVQSEDDRQSMHTPDELQHSLFFEIEPPVKKRLHPLK